MSRPTKTLPVPTAPFVLIEDHFEAWTGVVGLDNDGNLYECPAGSRSLICCPENLTEYQRCQIANEMIRRWNCFRICASL